MHILWMLFIGLIVGAVAKFIMPGKDPGGLWITMIIGIVGSLIAGYLGRMMGWYDEGAPIGFVASVLGSLLLLFLYRLMTNRGSR